MVLLLGITFDIHRFYKRLIVLYSWQHVVVHLKYITAGGYPKYMPDDALHLVENCLKKLKYLSNHKNLLL